MSDKVTEQMISHKIVSQILDHVFDAKDDMTDNDFVYIYHAFLKSGGSWQALIIGDMRCFEILKGILESWVEIKKHPEEYGLKR
jgi:hypothetical protein